MTCRRCPLSVSPSMLLTSHKYCKAVKSVNKCCSVFWIYLIIYCISHFNDRLWTLWTKRATCLVAYFLFTELAEWNWQPYFLIQRWILIAGVVKGCQTVSAQLNWESDRFPCPATRPVSSFRFRVQGVWVPSPTLFGQDRFPCVRQAALLLLGVRLIRELLAWASSLMDTLPLCLMNWATESNSAGVMEINFPLSSITPVGSTPESFRPEDPALQSTFIWVIIHCKMWPEWRRVQMKSKCDVFGSRKAL